MNRRKFIQSFVGAVASVSIGMKLSQGMPSLPETVRFGPNPSVRFKVTERIVAFSADWRGVYGTSVTA